MPDRISKGGMVMNATIGIIMSGIGGAVLGSCLAFGREWNDWRIWVGAIGFLAFVVGENIK